MPQHKRSDAAKVREVKRITTVAVRKAQVENDRPSVNRSTRARHALKVKADALDRVQDVLAGRR